jgi:hypothetical protein
MGVPLFAGVDSEKNFPPEIRTKLAKSDELKSTVFPMSESTKDNLFDIDKWHGRTIYNLTKKAIETWDNSSKSWKLILNTEFTPPEPIAPWDRYYVLPEEVRDRLALSEDFKHVVVSLDYRVIDDLLPEELWDGRVIFNTTTEQYQFWNADLEIWIKLLDSTYIPHKTQRVYLSYDGEVSLSNGQILELLYGSFFYLNQNGRVSLSFYFTLDVEDLTETEFGIRASLPLVNSAPLGFTSFGFGYLDRYLDSQRITSDIIMLLNGGEQYVSFYNYDAYNNGTVLNPVTHDTNYNNYINIGGTLKYYETS